MNTAALIGVITGIIVGIILVMIIFKFANSNGKIKTEYDERQQLNKGKGMTIAFYTSLILLGIFYVLSIAEVELPIDASATYAIVIFVSLTVGCVINIWNGSYFGINNNQTRYCIIFAALAILNLFPVIGCIRGREMISDGKISYPILNVLCLFMFLIIGVTIFIKQRKDSRDEEE